jgi:glutamate dehydrogenase (NAD(P)+)
MDTYSQQVGHSEPAVVTGKPPALGGSVARREATGRGLVSLLPVAAQQAKLDVEGACVSVHGFGNVGRYAALAAEQLGARVVAISDISGGVYNGKGLDIQDAMDYVDKHRTLEGFTGGGDRITNEELISGNCDVLMPCATGGVISADNAGDIKARLIMEGANGPTTLAADEILNDRGVIVVPDILANAGGVTVSYFEWVQDLQNYFWSESEIVGRLREIMSRAFDEVLSVATKHETDLRTAALIRGIRKVAAAKLARGVFP